MEDIIPQGRLAALLAAGHLLTYTEDTVIGDGWFADLRDQLGRVTESGGGPTQADALAHLVERVERDGIPAAAAVATPPAAGGSLEGMIAAHVAAGFEVSFTVGGGDGFWAHLDKADDPDAGCTSGGRTLAEALWAASPLHGDDVPFVATDAGALEHALEELWNYQSTLGARIHALEDKNDHRDDISLLILTIADLHQRVYPDGLVATRGDRPAPAGPGVDSHVWYCAKCGGQCIGTEPANSVCRGCGGQ